MVLFFRTRIYSAVYLRETFLPKENIFKFRFHVTKIGFNGFQWISRRKICLFFLKKRENTRKSVTGDLLHCILEIVESLINIF